MTYAKPKLVLLADARVAIQSTDGSGSDGSGNHKEGMGVEFTKQPTTGAYEADE